MSNIDDIVRRRLDIMAESSANEIATDSRRQITGETQLTSPDQIGSPEEPVKPLSLARRLMKRALGAPFPTVPRLLTGELMGSIRSSLKGDGMAEAIVDSEKLPYQQTGGGGGWRDEEGKPGGEVPARPFFGVSATALQNIERIAGNELGAMIAELDTQTVEMQMVINR